MTRRLNKVKESLRQTRDFAAGIFIGSATITPVFAATTDTLIDDMQMPILVGSLVLLLVGLLLRGMRKNTTSSPQPAAPREFSEGIGQYRLQLGRGDAD